MAPKTGLEAKFSFRLSAAMVLARRDTAVLSTFSDEACDNRELITLRDQVSVSPDPKLSETEAFVQVRTSDDKILNANFDINQHQPYKIKKEKLMRKASALLGENTACQIWDVISLGDPEEFKTLTQFKLN